MIRYLPAYIVPLLASLAGIAVFTRLLPPSEYGLYALVFSLIQLVQSLLFSWMNLGIKRFHERAERDAKLGALTATMYIGVIGNAALLAVLALGAQAAIAAGLFTIDSGISRLLWLAVATTLARQLSTCSKTFELAALSGARYVWMECGDSVVTLLVGVFLCWSLGLGASGILLGMAAGALLVVAADLPRLRRRLRGGVFDRDLQRQLVIFGAPVALAYFFEYVTASSDRLLIEHFLGSGAVGVYAVSYNLADRAIGSVFIALTMSAYPMMIRANEREGPAGAYRQATINVRILLTLALPALGGFVVIAPRVASVLMGPEYAPAASRIMPWIALGVFLFNFRMHYFTHALDLAGRTSLALAASIPGAILNLLMNVLLLPRFGLIAAVWSTVAAYALELAISVLQSRRIFPMPFPLGNAASALTGTVAMCVVLLILPFPGGLFGLVCQVVIGIGVYGLFALALDIGQARRETMTIAAKLRARGI